VGVGMIGKKIVEKMKFNEKFNSFRAKTITITVASLLLSMLLMISVSYKGMQMNSESSLSGFEESLDTVTTEYFDNYISTASGFVEERLYDILNEQAILAAISQRIFDNSQEFVAVNEAMRATDYFKDEMTFNGRWYQNSDDEPSTLLVQRYLLDSESRIRPEVQRLIDETVVMDLLLPSFQENGVEKEWVYFTGPENMSFMRVAPWNDIGTAIDSVYPEFTDQPNWAYFNPGLIQSWEGYIGKDPKQQEKLNQLSIISEPSQDGATGEMIVTIRHPLWNSNRNKVNGVISYDVSLNTTLGTIEEIQLGRSGFAFLADNDRNVIAINDLGMHILDLDKDGITEEISGYNRLNRQLSDSRSKSVQELKKPQSGEIIQEEVLIDDIQYVVIQKRLKSGMSYTEERGLFQNYWTLGFVVPKEEFFHVFHIVEDTVSENTERIILYQTLLAVITLLLMAAMIFDFNRSATRDLEKLLDVTEEIKNKNYDVTIDIDSKDEFGRLAIAFKSMIAEIKLTVQQLFEQNQLLKEEVDERKRKERIIDYLESYDPLTNLPNLSVFMRAIDEQVTFAKEKRQVGAVIIIGIDNFRHVNEVYSHETGNVILKNISERLSRLTHNVAMVSKLNGDEFGILLNQIKDTQDLISSVEKIEENFSERFRVDDKEIFITVSMGISTFPSDGFNSQLLYKNASSALLSAKEENRSSYKFFDNEMNREAKEKIELLTDLRHAIESEEFLLYYQPIVDVTTEEWTGLEALIRWDSPTRGLVSPAKFIPVAEESNLINQLSKWVIRRACSDLKKIHESGYQDFKISVNISPSDLKVDGFVEEVISILMALEIPPKYLSLEITEGVFIDDFEKTAEKFKQLREFGVRISVDDFGTGYSSLSYIKKLPVNFLKIDQSFVRGIPGTDDGTIASIINNLAKELNMRVIAEGVETIEQLTFLRDRGVEEAQGYYFSVPLPVDKMMNLLKNSMNKKE